MLQLTPLSVLCVILLLVGTTFSGTGLLAIWAGLSRRHWFPCTAVLVGIAALFLFVPVYELVLVVLVQSLLTILGLRLVRRRRASARSNHESPPEEPPLGNRQITLRDLLLLMVLAALVSATVAPIPGEIWSSVASLALSGSLLALGTLAATWIGLGSTRWGWRLLAACALFPTAIISLFLSLVRPSDSPPRLWKKGAVSLLVLLILIPPALALYAIRLPAIPEPPPADPDAYAAWLQAAQGLGNTEPSDTTLASLKAYVTQYGPVLEQAHAAVQRTGCVPLQYDLKDLNRQLPNVQQARQLARAFDYEATVAHSEGRHDDALRCCLDEFRLGNAMSQGGLLIDWLVKSAIDGIGTSRLAVLRHDLSASQCRQTIQTIQDIAAQSEPLDVVVTRDLAWEARCYPKYLFLMMQISQKLSSSPLPQALIHTDKYHRVQRHLLLTELALRAYRQEHGALPESLTELVPQYLPAVLEDPFSGKGLIYRRTAADHQLYSVGQDGKDDGGQVAAYPRYTSPGDYVLEESVPSISAPSTTESLDSTPEQ